MNRSRLLFLICSALLVLPMLLALVVAADPARGRHGAHDADAQDKEEDSYDSYLKYLKVFSEVLKLVRDTYVDEPNTDALMAGALEGVTDAMDPFSVYVPASAVAGYTQALATGKSLSGLALLKERGATLVMAVEKGSPAEGAGLKVGDLVAKLNGTSTRTLPLWQIQEAIAAAPGTNVTFEIIRLGVPISASFTLKTFAAPAVGVAEVAEVADTEQAGSPATATAAGKAAAKGAKGTKDTTGTPGTKGTTGTTGTTGTMGTAGKAGNLTASVLRIPSFNADTAGRVRTLLAAGPHAKLVVDLRGVSSGDSEAAYDVAKLFATGSLGALMRRDSAVRSFDSAAPAVWHGRLVVLVDRGTGGPAEVFASVLRQRAAAELVGERTLGYAGRRTTAELSSGSRLFFTDAFYAGPDKKPINESLKPDVAVTERSRTFLEKDIPMSDLILRRGLHHLLEESPEAAKKAA